MKIIYTAIPEDTNNDGYISEDDNHVLFISNESGRELVTITDVKQSVNNYTILNKDYLLITILSLKKTYQKKNGRKVIYFIILKKKKKYQVINFNFCIKKLKLYF